jgi:hypothetical protein
VEVVHVVEKGVNDGKIAEVGNNLAEGASKGGKDIGGAVADNNAKNKAS